MCESQEEIDVRKSLLAVLVSIALGGTIQVGNDRDDDNRDDHHDDGDWN